MGNRHRWAETGRIGHSLDRFKKRADNALSGLLRGATAMPSE